MLLLDDGNSNSEAAKAAAAAAAEQTIAATDAKTNILLHASTCSIARHDPHRQQSSALVSESPPPFSAAIDAVTAAEGVSKSDRSSNNTFLSVRDQTTTSPTTIHKSIQERRSGIGRRGSCGDGGDVGGLSSHYSSLQERGVGRANDNVGTVVVLGGGASAGGRGERGNEGELCVNERGGDGVGTPTIMVETRRSTAGGNSITSSKMVTVCNSATSIGDRVDIDGVDAGNPEMDRTCVAPRGSVTADKRATVATATAATSATGDNSEGGNIDEGEAERRDMEKKAGNDGDVNNDHNPITRSTSANAGDNSDHEEKVWARQNTTATVANSDTGRSTIKAEPNSSERTASGALQSPLAPIRQSGWTLATELDSTGANGSEMLRTTTVGRTRIGWGEAGGNGDGETGVQGIARRGVLGDGFSSDEDDDNERHCGEQIMR